MPAGGVADVRYGRRLTLGSSDRALAASLREQGRRQCGPSSFDSRQRARASPNLIVRGGEYDHQRANSFRPCGNGPGRGVLLFAGPPGRLDECAPTAGLVAWCISHASHCCGHMVSRTSHCGCTVRSSSCRGRRRGLVAAASRSAGVGRGGVGYCGRDNALAELNDMAHHLEQSSCVFRN